MIHTAGRPRIAPQNAPGGKRRSLHRTVPVDRRVPIVRARRVVATDRPEQRADRPLVQLDQRKQWILHRAPLPSSRSRAASRSRASCSWDASPEPGNARTTTRLPGGSTDRRSRTRWRSCRFTRVRTTAPPTALLTTKPARAGKALSPGACGSGSPLRMWTTRSGRPALRPRRTAAANSSRRLSRCSVGSTSQPVRNQADRRARPLPRRDARIARPARVRIRSLNPWVLARRRLFGWKVRLLTQGLQRMMGDGGHRLAVTVRPRVAALVTPVCTASRSRIRDLCPSEAGGSSHRQLDLVTVRGITPSGQTSSMRTSALYTACGQRLERRGSP